MFSCILPIGWVGRYPVERGNRFGSLVQRHARWRSRLIWEATNHANTTLGRHPRADGAGGAPGPGHPTDGPGRRLGPGLATTEMARWLEERHRLNPSEVASVLGTAMRYDIAEVVDPLVNVVARVPKKALARLQKSGR